MQVHNRKRAILHPLATIRIGLLVRAIRLLGRRRTCSQQDLGQHVLITNDGRPRRIALLASEIETAGLRVEMRDLRRGLLLVQLLVALFRRATGRLAFSACFLRLGRRCGRGSVGARFGGIFSFGRGGGSRIIASSVRLLVCAGVGGFGLVSGLDGGGGLDRFGLFVGSCRFICYTETSLSVARRKKKVASHTCRRS